MSNFFDNVKKLRDRTGISILDCKKALMESNNDIDLAVVYLRKSGAAVVENKSSRQTNNGVISFLVCENKKDGVIIEINCETDFVAKSEDFINFCNKVCEYYLSEKFLCKIFYLSENEITLSKELIELKIDLISRFRENLIVKRIFKTYSNHGFIFGYLHFDNKLGVILNIDKDDKNLAKDVLIQIASMKPKYLSTSEISGDVLFSEKQIYLDKLKNKYPDKDDTLLSKMLEGQMNKFFAENVLLEQTFVKDNKKTIKQLISSKINILSFNLFCLGQN